MKKLSLYLFLVLMWCNVGVAEQVEFSCKVGSFDLWGMTSEDKQRFKKKTIKFLVDTDEMKIYNNNEDDELSVIHGIETSIDIKDGINKATSLTGSISEENKKTEKQPIIKTQEELLLEYKEIFFKYPLTGVYMDSIQMEDGSKITFKDVKDFSERKFFNMLVADSGLKQKLRSLYVEYKNAVKQNKQSFIDNKKKIDKAKKERMKKKWGKVFNYSSGLIVHKYYTDIELRVRKLKTVKTDKKQSENEKGYAITYKYRGHVYWGGYKRKGFVVEIMDPQVKGTKIKIGRKVFYKKKTLINFFDRQIKSSLWTYQFNFGCK